MENTIDIRDGGADAPFTATLSSEANGYDAAPAVVPAQPMQPDLSGYDVALFDTDWPPFTALWMLGGDSD